MNHCLEKNPEARFHSARDLGFALEALSGSSVSGQTLTALTALSTRSRMTKHLPWIVAGVLFIALLAALPFVISSLRRAPVDTPVTRVSVLPPWKNLNLENRNIAGLTPFLHSCNPIPVKAEP